MGSGKVIRQKKSEDDGWIQKGKADGTFLFLVCVLLVAGLLMLFSASYSFAYARFGNSYRFILRQGIFAVLGVGVMLALSKINCRVYKKLAWPLYAVSLALLLALLIMKPMNPGTDVRRWFVLGPVNFQPSELAKFSVILLFSTLAGANYSRMKTFRYGILFFGALLAAPCALIIKEPHLSATILLFAIGVVLMVIGGAKIWQLLICAGAAAAAVLVLVLAKGGLAYVRPRLETWLDPWSDPLGEGMQTIQSLLAIGSGGFFGRGFGQSRQKYQWVAAPHNDFIFSIWCEEFGFFGAVLLILVFCLLVWRGFRIAMRAPDKYSSMLAVGLVFQIGLQAALNILVTTNTIPNTGISLPFFSYGGSSLVILLAEMGVVLSVSRAGNRQAAEQSPGAARETGGAEL